MLIFYLDSLSQSDPQTSGASTAPDRADFDPSIIIRTYASTSASIAGGSSANGDDDARALEELKPQWIVMYDPDVGFVRRVEV